MLSRNCRKKQTNKKTNANCLFVGLKNLVQTQYAIPDVGQVARDLAADCKVKRGGMDVNTITI